jgi:hypothetical protein
VSQEIETRRVVVQFQLTVNVAFVEPGQDQMNNVGTLQMQGGAAIPAPIIQSYQGHKGQLVSLQLREGINAFPEQVVEKLGELCEGASEGRKPLVTAAHMPTQ